MKKRVILFALICLMFFSFSITVYAESDEDKEIISSEEEEKIIDVLKYVESDAKSFGLSGIDFNNLQISDAIPLYEYKSQEFFKIGETYPIISDGHIVALATKCCEDKYSLETALAQKIDLLGYKNIAIICDSESEYIYDGSTITEVMKLGIIVEDRDSISDSSLMDYSGISLTNIETVEYLNYSEYQSEITRQNYYFCNVSYVTQNPYNNLCWAATTACIKNYLSGTTLNAAAVSMAYFNVSTVMNIKVPSSDVANFMQNTYGLSYTYNNYRPSDNAILNNITGGYPIYGSFSWTTSSSSGYHACTIYGVNPISGYISVMNPSQGAMVAATNGTTYVFTVGGTSYSLARGICHSW